MANTVIATTPAEASAGLPLGRLVPSAEDKSGYRPPPSEPQLLDQALDLANQERFEEAVTVCERHLRQQGPTLRGLLPDGHDLPGGRRPSSGRRVLSPGGLSRSHAWRGTPCAGICLAERRGDSSRRGWLSPPG